MVAEATKAAKERRRGEKTEGVRAGRRPRAKERKPAQKTAQVGRRHSVSVRSA